MGADGKEFHRRALVEAEAVRGQQIAHRQRQVVGHAAVAVDAENGDFGATVGLAATTGNASAAAQIRIDDHRVTLGKPRSLRRLHDLHGEFMAHHPRILQERMLAFVDVIIGAADADAPNTDQRFTSRHHWVLAGFDGEFAGVATDERLHHGSLSWFGVAQIGTGARPGTQAR